MFSKVSTNTYFYYCFIFSVSSISQVKGFQKGCQRDTKKNTCRIVCVCICKLYKRCDAQSAYTKPIIIVFHGFC